MLTHLHKLMLLAVGGSLGTISRYVLSSLIHRFCGTAFAWGTLAVNLSGSFLIGFLFALGESRLMIHTPQTRLLLVVGFLGAFTTFSTYMLDSYHMFQTGRPMLAWLNIVGSTGLGLALLMAGIGVGKAV